LLNKRLTATTGLNSGLAFFLHYNPVEVGAKHKRLV
jgi:hypothetical protein